VCAEGDSGVPLRRLEEAQYPPCAAVLHELYPSKEALDAAGTGAADALSEKSSSWTSFSSRSTRPWGSHELVDHQEREYLSITSGRN
jgi:hypothetical protein